MDKDTKLMLGRILGEIYRVESAMGMDCRAGPARIYGLLKGFETAIDEELAEIGGVEAAKIKAVMDVLEPIWRDEERLAAFTGFYDIEDELEARRVSRGDAIKILSYLNANGQFREVIGKMNSQNSPVECKTFELSEWDS